MFASRIRCTVIAPVVLIFLCACATTDDSDKSATVYFESAMEAIDAENYTLAIEQLIQLNNRHPFSIYAEQALLELSHLYFRNGQYIESKATLDRFLRQYGNSDQLDYVYYLRAMSQFNQDRTFLQNYTSADPALRDIVKSTSAYRDFLRVVEKYPSSRFAADARLHMRYVRDLWAHKQILIAGQYLENGAWVAAANRANHVLEHYVSSSDSVVQALEILTIAYRKMGLDEQAKQADNLLVKNFPQYVRKIADE